MENGYYPAGASFDNRAPFNKKRTEDCDACEGKGTGMFSCCTGELIHDHELGLCPECLEHLVNVKVLVRNQNNKY